MEKRGGETKIFKRGAQAGLKGRCFINGGGAGAGGGGTPLQTMFHYPFSDVPRQVSLLSCRDVFVCRACLGHNF